MGRARNTLSVMENETRQVVTLRLTDEEKRVIRAVATHDGLPLSAWIRATALSVARKRGVTKSVTRTSVSRVPSEVK